MKKLLALLAAICLMGSFAFAEEEPDSWIRYDWSDEMAEDAAAKEFYKVDFKALERGLSMYIPKYLQASESTDGQSEGLIARWADEGQARSITVSLKMLPDGKDLTAKLQALEGELKKDGWDRFLLILVNEASGVRFSRDAQKEEAVLFPVAEDAVLIMAFSPTNQEEFRKDYEMALCSLDAVE